MKRVQIGAAMLRDRKGNIVPEPWLFTPKNGSLSIPMDGQEHARPIIVLEDEDGKNNMQLIIRQNGIEVIFNDNDTARGLITYDDLWIMVTAADV